VPFFTTHVPRAWDLDSYLASSTHPPNRTPAEIFARWKTALSQISKCRVARCCSNTARHRADLLLQMYKGKVRILFTGVSTARIGSFLLPLASNGRG
jgi:hypothetical protein